MSFIAFVATSMDTSSEHRLDYVKNAISFAGTLINIFAVFLQTAFMLNVTRIIAPQGNYEVEKNWLKVGIMFVALSNIFIWIHDSFIHIHLEDNVGDKYFGAKNWYSITHLMLPFIIFYRFNSFFILIGGFLDH